MPVTDKYYIEVERENAHWVFRLVDPVGRTVFAIQDFNLVLRAHGARHHDVLAFLRKCRPDKHKAPAIWEHRVLEESNEQHGK